MPVKVENVSYKATFKQKALLIQELLLKINAPPWVDDNLIQISNTCQKTEEANLFPPVMCN